jgi:hypothetical protein
MISRHDSLHHALQQVESGALRSVSTIVFSHRWWHTLSADERAEFRERASRHSVTLRADSQLTSHYVEARGEDGPSLSSEGHA